MRGEDRRDLSSWSCAKSSRRSPSFFPRLPRHLPELRTGGRLAAPAAGTRVRDPPSGAWAPISPTGASGSRRPGIDSHHPERRAWRPPPRSTRSPELTWRLAAASRAACGRGPGGTAGCASQAAAARLALHPPAAPRPPGESGERGQRGSRGGGGGAARGGATQESERAAAGAAASSSMTVYPAALWEFDLRRQPPPQLAPPPPRTPWEP